MKDRIKIDRKRHMLKAITWRILASLITFLIVIIATGKPKVGLSIGIVDFFAKLIIYYIHERVWYKSNFGISGKRANQQDPKTHQ